MNSDKISRQTFSLPFREDIVELRIRNNHLWANLSSRKLVYGNLGADPFYQSFEKHGLCRMFFVSPSGEACFCGFDSKFGTKYIVLSVSRTDRKKIEERNIQVIPDNIVSTAAWITRIDRGQPLLFVALDGINGEHRVAYFDLSRKVLQCNVINLEFSSKFHKMHLAKREDGIEMYSLTEHGGQWMIEAMSLDHNFLPSNTHRKRSSRSIVLSGKPGAYSQDTDYLGCVLPGMLFGLITRGKQRIQFGIPYSSFEFFGFAVIGDIIVGYGPQKLRFYQMISARGIDVNDKSELLCEVNLPDVNVFESDTIQQVVYGVFKNKIYAFKFESEPRFKGLEGIKSWLYWRMIGSKEWTKAADVLLRMRSLGFNGQIVMARGHSLELELHLFTELLKLTSEKTQFSKMRSVVAMMALDLYARLECGKEHPNAEAFVKWAQGLRREKLLSENTIRDVLLTYGWDEALRALSDPVYAFDFFMETLETKEALVQLEKMPGGFQFVTRALRLYQIEPEGVSRIVTTRTRELCGSLIPVLSLDCSRDFFSTFYHEKRPDMQWFLEMYCLQLSLDPTSEDLAIRFISDNYPDVELMEFIVRSFMSTKRYQTLALGYDSRARYRQAAQVAAFGDPAAAFPFMQKMPPATKKRCAMHVLNSLKRNVAERVASEQLLHGNLCDIGTVIEYLPESTKVRELAEIASDYIADRGKDYAVCSEEAGECCSAIDLLHKFSESKTSEVVRLNGYQLCLHCGKSLLTENVIMYPCMHGFHETCAQEMVDGEVNPADVIHGCPLCGIHAVRMINIPFLSFTKSSEDPWAFD